MRRVSIDDFERLLAASHPYSISLYLDTHEVGREVAKRVPQYKELSREVVEQLQQLGAPSTDIQKVNKALERIAKSDEFTDLQHAGFAVFVSPAITEYYPLPINVSNLAIVSHRFHLKPLVRLITQPCEFYVLALSKEEVKLFKGDRYEMRKVHVPDLPQRVEEVVGTETSERHLQFHTKTKAPNGATRPAIYHGSSSWKDDQQKYLDRFLQQVNKSVTHFLINQKEPLLLAGVERMLTNYREVNTYPHLVKDIALKGNIESQTLAEIYHQALEILEPYFIQQEKETVEKYFAHGTSAKFSTDLDEILRQASQGRVDTLLVAQGVREWGSFNQDTLRVTYTDEPQAEADDLLDIACIQTLRNGGKAFVLPPEEIPHHTHAAAVFRY